MIAVKCFCYSIDPILKPTLLGQGVPGLCTTGRVKLNQGWFKKFC